MTRAFFQPATATPTQRNRRLLLSLPACAVPMLSACGGGADFEYVTEQPLYFVGKPITPNAPKPKTPNPNTTGHTAPTFSVKPALPPGLVLNPQTGVISGTPTQLRRQSAHTVTARNNQGNAEAQVCITVTGEGKWNSVPTTTGTRQAGCTAPLPGGKVLVTGGVADGQWTQSSQIFDPITASWTPAAPQLLLHVDLMGIALRDGRVLVFGGSTGAAGKAELYDAATNSWSMTGNMVAPRAAASSLLLPDGKVLVMGGLHDGAPVNTVELFNPGTGTWTALPRPLSVSRFGHAAVLLPDGRSVLLTGGLDLPGPVNNSELYALNGSASTVMSSGVTGGPAKAVRLDDGSALFVTNANVSWRFNPRTSSWKTSPLPTTSNAVFSQLVLLADGRVLRAGGSDLPTTEIYNPDVNIWTPAAPMAQARFGPSAALLNNGRVLMYGGGSPENTTEIYTP